MSGRVFRTLAEAMAERERTELMERIARALEAQAGTASRPADAPTAGEAGAAAGGAAAPLVPWSPKAFPNLHEAYSECLVALRKSHQPMTWESVAGWLQENYDLPRRQRPSGGYADVHAKTVAGWARKAGLPAPWE